jgi:hypothetical protein
MNFDMMDAESDRSHQGAQITSAGTTYCAGLAEIDSKNSLKKQFSTKKLKSKIRVTKKLF